MKLPENETLTIKLDVDATDAIKNLGKVADTINIEIQRAISKTLVELWLAEKKKARNAHLVGAIGFALLALDLFFRPLFP